MKKHPLFSLLAALALALGLVPFAGPPGIAQAATPTELFFSEYIEGSSNNKALEIYNGTGAAVNLTTGGYNLLMSFNGGHGSTYDHKPEWHGGQWRCSRSCANPIRQRNHSCRS